METSKTVIVRALKSVSITLPSGHDKAIGKGSIVELPEQFGRGSYIKNKIFEIVGDSDIKKKVATLVKKETNDITKNLIGTAEIKSILGWSANEYNKNKAKLQKAGMKKIKGKWLIDPENLKVFKA